VHLRLLLCLNRKARQRNDLDSTIILSGVTITLIIVQKVRFTC